MLKSCIKSFACDVSTKRLGRPIHNKRSNDLARVGKPVNPNTGFGVERGYYSRASLITLFSELTLSFV